MAQNLPAQPAPLAPLNLADETKHDRVTLDELLTNYAFTLAVAVVVLIGLGAVASLTLAFGTPLPSPPVAPTPPIPTNGLEDYKGLVDRYRDFSDIQVKRFTDTFQLVVVTALLPSFTALLGYMFGKRSA